MKTIEVLEETLAALDSLLSEVSSDHEIEMVEKAIEHLKPLEEKYRRKDTL